MLCVIIALAGILMCHDGINALVCVYYAFMEIVTSRLII